MFHLFIDEGHVILLGTDPVRFEACVASQAWIHFVITHRDDLHMMMLCSSFGKSFSQQFCIATLTRASGYNQYVHRYSDNGNTCHFRYSFNVVPARVRNAAFNKEGFIHTLLFFQILHDTFAIQRSRVCDACLRETIKDLVERLHVGIAKVAVILSFHPSYLAIIPAG